MTHGRVLSSLPLHDLAPSPCQALLHRFGEFPEKYRLLIWRFLLRLPENNGAFRALVAKGVHPAFRDLHKRYPINDTRLFRRLRRIVSALAFWSPGERFPLPRPHTQHTHAQRPSVWPLHLRIVR